jgi:predicted DNA-binding transcriptional regulator YafY
MADRNHRQKGLSKEQSKIRVLAIERMVTEGQKITAAEIRNRLWMQYDMQVSLATIYSDLRAIDKFIPLEANNGHGGGYKKFDFCGGIKNG